MSVFLVYFLFLGTLSNYSKILISFDIKFYNMKEVSTVVTFFGRIALWA